MIVFHSQALAELRQAQAWYRAKSMPTAERFFERVREAIKRAMADPASHPVAGRGMRYVRVFKFPFVLVYRIRQEGDVFILAIAHTSRRPGYWNRRK